ncbi:MAG: hypothetical protein DI533_16960 [Cereibacter sphaeroides]|uniref:PRC-barrel domain-containing protein n=1 Tax=Cereibacter sphaeroides TaxID=1063 RepID=A0A2W5SAP2_CERSP|nr:MAG: hypothetical protein DI533_16960 [Cereibacter sphaeroides]
MRFPSSLRGTSCHPTRTRRDCRRHRSRARTADDEEIGTVSHIHGAGKTATVIIDVGGFLRIGAKPVALTAAEIDLMRDERGSIHGHTYRTKQELKDLSEMPTEPRPSIHSPNKKRVAWRAQAV